MGDRKVSHAVTPREKADRRRGAVMHRLCGPTAAAAAGGDGEPAAAAKLSRIQRTNHDRRAAAAGLPPGRPAAPRVVGSKARNAPPRAPRAWGAAHTPPSTRAPLPPLTPP